MVYDMRTERMYPWCTTCVPSVYPHVAARVPKVDTPVSPGPELYSFTFLQVVTIYIFTITFVSVHVHNCWFVIVLINM